jgi:hypothetical protein
MMTEVLRYPSGKPMLIPIPSTLKLTRFAGTDMPDALRIETSVGRVTIISGEDVRALCQGLLDMFPEHFG